MAYSVARRPSPRRLVPKGFACLGQELQIVPAAKSSANAALFLRNRKSSCPYYFDFGSGYLCTCPTRYAIYKQSGS
jgi:hypothetical protein